VRPDHFCEQLLVAGKESTGLSPEIDKALQIVDKQGQKEVDRRLPRNVVGERLVRIAIDDR